MTTTNDAAGFIKLVLRLRVLVSATGRAGLLRRSPRPVLEAVPLSAHGRCQFCR
jgi:hypothetical protein